jgi:hypothetical protein
MPHRAMRRADAALGQEKRGGFHARVSRPAFPARYGREVHRDGREEGRP